MYVDSSWAGVSQRCHKSKFVMGWMDLAATQYFGLLCTLELYTEQQALNMM
jgi:hypothetical protein